MDALLDRAQALQRILASEFEGSDSAVLNSRLSEVVSEVRVTVEGKRVILDPVLRPEWMPEGDWHTLDFGDPTQEGVPHRLPSPRAAAGRPARRGGKQGYL